MLASSAAGAAPADGTVALPRLAGLPRPGAWRWPEVSFGPRAGKIALATIVGCALDRKSVV